jgi:hypothetical protein
MNVLTLLDMATGMPDRVGIGRLQATGSDQAGLTYPELLADLLAAERGGDVMTGQLLHDIHPFNGSDNDA